MFTRSNNGVNGVQLLAALQPTAAVAGLPRKAMDFILEHEPFARGLAYAGSVRLYPNASTSRILCGVRSALVVMIKYNCFAGAGIVPGIGG
ncbi:chorismate-binding protein [Vibrio chagasii]|nr:chorismate-binding protein [Vibrio chagasii]